MLSSVREIAAVALKAGSFEDRAAWRLRKLKSKPPGMHQGWTFPLFVHKHVKTFETNKLDVWCGSLDDQ